MVLANSQIILDTQITEKIKRGGTLFTQFTGYSSIYVYGVPHEGNFTKSRNKFLSDEVVCLSVANSFFTSI